MAVLVEGAVPMGRPLMTTDEIGRICERIERQIEDMDRKVDVQGERLSDLSIRVAVFEATRPSMFKPIASAGAAAAGGGGLIYGLVEVLKHFMGK